MGYILNRPKLTKTSTTIYTDDLKFLKEHNFKVASIIRQHIELFKAAQDKGVNKELVKELEECKATKAKQAAFINWFFREVQDEKYILLRENGLKFMEGKNV